MLKDRETSRNAQATGAEPIFVRRGDFIVFNQLGVKLELPDELSMPTYFRWLDRMRSILGGAVDGAEIAEKQYARTKPRLNVGVYYDTPKLDLARLGAVLRTTCNKITHAFCAYKEAPTADGVRRDHRYVFAGEEKACIQTDPTSHEAISIVTRLLARREIEQPGKYLYERLGIDPQTLQPSIRIALLRHPFFVWLDGKDSLRCVMDCAVVSDLRNPNGNDNGFLELELPLYPRIDPVVAADPRTVQLIEVLRADAENRLGAVLTTKNKYQRAAAVLGLGES